jgi:hypothetical protein
MLAASEDRVSRQTALAGLTAFFVAGCRSSVWMCMCLSDETVKPKNARNLAAALREPSSVRDRFEPGAQTIYRCGGR